jgi:hypothetical protein
MWTEADALERMPLTALQLGQQAEPEEDGYEAAASAAAAAAAGVTSDADDGAATGPSAPPQPSQVDVVREINLKRVHDDEEEVREMRRKAGKREYAPGEKPVLEFHIGPTGTSKTRAVFDKYKSPEAFHWYPSNGGHAVWMDGYEGHGIIVLDEYRGEVPFNHAKFIFGFQPCTFQTKGGPTLQVLA